MACCSQRTSRRRKRLNQRCATSTTQRRGGWRSGWPGGGNGWAALRLGRDVRGVAARRGGRAARVVVVAPVQAQVPRPARRPGGAIDRRVEQVGQLLHVGAVGPASGPSPAGRPAHRSAGAAWSPHFPRSVGFAPVASASPGPPCILEAPGGGATLPRQMGGRRTAAPLSALTDAKSLPRLPPVRVRSMAELLHRRARRVPMDKVTAPRRPGRLPICADPQARRGGAPCCRRRSAASSGSTSPRRPDGLRPRRPRRARPPAPATHRGDGRWARPAAGLARRLGRAGGDPHRAGGDRPAVGAALRRADRGRLHGAGAQPAPDRRVGQQPRAAGAKTDALDAPDPGARACWPGWPARARSRRRRSRRCAR